MGENMNKEVLMKIIQISSVLVEKYNLTLDEAVECIVSYKGYSFFTDKETMQIFLTNDYKTWAERMYEKTNLIKTIKVIGKGSLVGEEPWDSSQFLNNNDQKEPYLKLKSE